MALENYIEMRDKVDDADFLLRRQLERVLAERHPGVFVPRYSMVTFMRIPYSVAWARGEIQRGILMDCCEGKSRIGDVDLGKADALVKARLLLAEDADAYVKWAQSDAVAKRFQ